MKKIKTKINWTNKDTIVFGDFHIGSRVSRIKKLHSFLSILIKNPPKRVVVNGDAFEFWSTNYKEIGEIEYAIIEKFLKLSQKGVKIVYIPGNHDRAFRTFIKITLGKIKLRREYIIKSGSKKYLIVHGDEFDVFTQRHIIISLILDKIYEFFVRFSRFSRKSLGFSYTPASMKNNLGQYKKIVRRIKRAALVYAKLRMVDGIIVGHTHYPEYYKNKSGLVYVNSGDWIGSCSYVVIGKSVSVNFFK